MILFLNPPAPAFGLMPPDGFTFAGVQCSAGINVLMVNSGHDTLAWTGLDSECEPAIREVEALEIGGAS